MARKAKPLIGWEEWCTLPDLGLPAIKAKIDTGAKTSALHAFDIKNFTHEGQSYVRFSIHPLQKNKAITRVCEAPLLEWRSVTSSNGEREKRPVILTTIKCGSTTIKAELTLTSRHKMAFRMLLGRQAMVKAKLAVDPAKSYLQGKIENAMDLYAE